ncbi:serine/threonine protein phosphatase [Pseudooceanicola marinus]|nr:serine/threonine protein phosphatase [Pseudooceanicola marinus]
MMVNQNESSCCGRGRKPDCMRQDDASYMAAALAVPLAAHGTRQELHDALVSIPAGHFEMGTRVSRYARDLDSPRRRVKVSGFRIADATVCNAEYARFINETGYRTVSEVEGWSYVFHLQLADPTLWPLHPPGLPWWRLVHGASWAQPEGPGSSWENRADHPAVHLTWFDALAYVTWAGLRLPREAEWERAARGGLVNKKFPWGNKLVPESGFAMNTWQGDFPHTNSGEDGYIGTAPVRSYAPNGYGLYNMTGNIWEWVQDFYGPRPTPSRLPEQDPTGPQTGSARIQRGGSYLCHVSYCDRYHVHSRTWNDANSSTANCGLRVASNG